MKISVIQAIKEIINPIKPDKSLEEVLKNEEGLSDKEKKELLNKSEGVSWSWGYNVSETSRNDPKKEMEITKKIDIKERKVKPSKESNGREPGE